MAKVRFVLQAARRGALRAFGGLFSLLSPLLPPFPLLHLLESGRGFPPTPSYLPGRGFESAGTFNPSVVKKDGKFVMLYRAQDHKALLRSGMLPATTVFISRAGPRAGHGF